MTPVEVAPAFVDAINRKDVERLAELMIADHKFIDGGGSEHVGKDPMKMGWSEHLALIPDLYANQCALHEIADRISGVEPKTPRAP